MKDLLTIAIPVYERITYFEEAIMSALNQTVSCRIIVVDNASSHNKFEEYVKELNNPLVQYYRNDRNVGVTMNMNICIKYTQTPWMTSS